MPNFLICVSTHSIDMNMYSFIFFLIVYHIKLNGEKNANMYGHFKMFVFPCIITFTFQDIPNIVLHYVNYIILIYIYICYNNFKKIENFIISI